MDKGTSTNQLKKEGEEFNLSGHLSGARAELKKQEGEIIVDLSIDTIHAGRYQPRLIFRENQIREMAYSILEKGVLDPIIVRPVDVPEWKETYELVSGERRLRGARLAGLTKIPAIVRAYSDVNAREIALIVNDQGVQLTMAENAKYISDLRDVLGDTATVAQRIAKHEKTVEKYIRAYKAMSCTTEIFDIFLKEGDDVDITAALQFASIAPLVRGFSGIADQKKSKDSSGPKNCTPKKIKTDRTSYKRIVEAFKKKGIKKALPDILKRLNPKKVTENKEASSAPQTAKPENQKEMVNDTEKELVIIIRVEKTKPVTEETMRNIHDAVDDFLKKIGILYSLPAKTEA